MTQFEVELKQSQLFRTYCAQAELLIQELMNNGIELQAARQPPITPTKNCSTSYTREVEMERKLHELRTEHMARHAQPRQKK